MFRLPFLVFCALAAELPCQGPGYADSFLDVTPPATTWVPNAHFHFFSNDPAATFEYRLDGGAWTPTADQHAVFGQLSASTHSFEVRAVLNGLPDLTPASHSWTIEQAVSADTATLTDDGVLFPALGEDVYSNSGGGQGQTYFANRDAAAGGDGSYLSPFSSLQEGVDALYPGDRLFLMPSLTPYSAAVIDSPWGDASAALPIQVLGVPGALIQAGAAYDGPMIQVMNSGWEFQGLAVDVANQRENRVFEINDGSSTVMVTDVVIDSCQLTDHGLKTGVSSDDAIAINLASQRVRISNNTIHGFWQGDPVVGDDCHGIVVRRGTADIEVLGNHIYDNSGDGIQLASANPNQTAPVPSDVTIRGNHIHDHRENAADLKSCDGVLVAENLMYGAQGDIPAYGAGCVVKVHAEARGVVIERNHMHTGVRGIDVGKGNGTGEGPEDLVIHRNYLYGNGYERDGQLQLEYGIYYNVYPDAGVSPAPKSLQISHNILKGWGTSIRANFSNDDMDSVVIVNNGIFEPYEDGGSPGVGLSLATVPTTPPLSNLEIAGLAFVGSTKLVRVEAGGNFVPPSMLPNCKFGVGPATMLNGELSTWDLPATVWLYNAGVSYTGYGVQVSQPDIGISELP